MDSIDEYSMVEGPLIVSGYIEYTIEEEENNLNQKTCSPKELTEDEHDRFMRYAQYVEMSLRDRLSELQGIVLDEKLLYTTYTEKLYTIRTIDNPTFKLTDSKEVIYNVLGNVIQKYYNEIEKLKNVFCHDRNLYILMIQTLPLNVTGDEHEMRMLITVAPE